VPDGLEAGVVDVGERECETGSPTTPYTAVAGVIDRKR
jgi:hypothetical protein